MDQPVALSAFQETVERYYRRNFIAGLVHGVFFRVSAALVDTNTVLPAFISALTGSEVAVGMIASFIGLGGVLPELFAAYWVEGRPRKKPILLGVITIRWISWVVLAWLTYAYGLTHPTLVLTAFAVLVLTFSLAGGVGSVVYGDIFARAIPAERRGRFAAWKNLLGFALAIAAGMVVKRILQDEVHFPFPKNYALLFGLSGVTLGIAFTGFAMIREPVYPIQRPVASLREMFSRSRALLQSSRDFQYLLVAQALFVIGAALAPFYVVYARQELHVPAGMVGVFLSAQMIGAALSNLVWGWLGDTYGNRVVLLGVALGGMTAAVLALVTPLIAPELYTLVFLALGATMSGMGIGYGNILLEMAPTEVMPTCIALRDTIMAPFTLVPIGVGVLVQRVPYAWGFALGGLFMLLSFLTTWRLRDPRQHPESVCRV